jgi:hypothetical protein
MKACFSKSRSKNTFLKQNKQILAILTSALDSEALKALSGAIESAQQYRRYASI